MTNETKPKNFSLSYLIKGEGKKDWYKALGLGLRWVVIVLVSMLLVLGAWNVWTLFSPKKTSNINKPTFKVQEGGHVNYTVVQQVTAPPRENIHVIPYLDASGGTHSYSYCNNGGSNDWEVRVGVRMEFDGLFQNLFWPKQEAKQDVQSAVTTANQINNP